MQQQLNNAIETLTKAVADFRHRQEGRRRIFPSAIRMQAVALMHEGAPVAHLSRATGLPRSMLYKWRRWEGLDRIKQRAPHNAPPQVFTVDPSSAPPQRRAECEPLRVQLGPYLLTVTVAQGQP